MIELERRSMEIERRYAMLFAELGMPLGSEWLRGLSDISDRQREHMTEQCSSCAQQVRRIAEGRAWIAAEGNAKDAAVLTANFGEVWTRLGIARRQQVIAAADRLVIDAVDAAMDVREAWNASRGDPMETSAVLGNAATRSCEAWSVWSLLEDAGEVSLLFGRDWRKTINDSVDFCAKCAEAIQNSTEMKKMKETWAATTLFASLVGAKSAPAILEFIR